MPAQAALDPEVWGPPFWFFLHTITMTYPHHPNAVTKKKYYEFVQNLPLFLPNEAMCNDFSKLLDRYPVAPYLDNRESFIKWMHFIHNKVNEKLEKPKISLDAFYASYYEAYENRQQKDLKYQAILEKGLYAVILGTLFFLIVYLYDK